MSDGMRDLSDFLSYVLPHAPACPEPVAVQYLRVAATEWCERTRCWRETDELPTAAYEIEVLCVPPFSSLHEIEAAWFDGRPLTPKSFHEAWPDDRGDTGARPRWITQAQPNTVRLIPRGTGTLRISMFLKPAPDADVVPGFLFDQWVQPLADGALARILALPDPAYANPTAAVVYRSAFDAAANRNFAANIRGQQRASSRARAQFL